MLKVGVLGAGHLGKIHLKCLKNLPEHYELVGFYDANQANASQVAQDLGLPTFNSINDLIAAVDVVDIVTPTLNHFECASAAAKQGKHFFIEKPITETPEQAKKLITLAQNANIKAQVGHVERFNPAYVAASGYVKNPMFIETHRLAEFNPRGTDVPVVLDLMIHDIDIVLNSVKSPVKKVSASGVAVVSNNPDIANARLEFENGCVANLTASRISLKNMRKTRIFQKDAYVTIDFLEKQSEVVRMKNAQEPIDPYAMIMDLGNGQKKQIYFEQPKALPTNAIQEELKSFANAINKNTNPSVTLNDGYLALSVAHQILGEIETNQNTLS